MKTNEAEILKDSAQDMHNHVHMDNFFGNNKRKDKRNPLVMCDGIEMDSEPEIGSQHLLDLGIMNEPINDELATSYQEWQFSGAIATAGVLVAGLVSFRQGKSSRSQMLMRARVGFQAATVALLVGSVYFQGR